MPYATVNDRRLFYAASQTPDAPTLVLIHGAGGNHLHWPPELRRLPGATVYALDLPGRGRSDGPGHNAVPDYAKVLIGFLDAVQADRAMLMGHSMGGAIAIRGAARIPELRVVVAQSAYTSVEDNVADGVRALLGLPPDLFAPLVVWFAHAVTG